MPANPQIGTNRISAQKPRPPRIEINARKCSQTVNLRALVLSAHNVRQLGLQHQQCDERNQFIRDPAYRKDTGAFGDVRTFLFV